MAYSNAKSDVYEQVTARIIDQLENGIFPWQCPWNKSAPVGGMPVNISTKRPYSGVNVLLLWLAQADGGFSSHRWLTFKQAETLGANVRKGEKGTRIVYADKFIPAAEKERAAQAGEEASAMFFLKSYSVFNADQIEGLEPVAPAVELPPREQNEHGEALIAASGADFRIGGNAAFYSPAADYVQVPDQRQFREQIDYYRTASHELCHWTGHKSRLARPLENRFGSPQYAREELVAEMGAAFLCASLGIRPTVRHADYLGSWLKVLREDSRAIVKAASAASKASDYLLAKLAAHDAAQAPAPALAA